MEQVTCPKCGCLDDFGWPFCPYCGERPATYVRWSSDVNGNAWVAIYENNTPAPFILAFSYGRVNT